MNWIPVSERLPKDDSARGWLVFAPKSPGPRIFMTWCIPAYWGWDYPGKHSITHWMPLPDPPEET